MISRENYVLFKCKIRNVVAAIKGGKDTFTLTVEGLMSSLCLHEQQMNQRINSTNLK